MVAESVKSGNPKIIKKVAATLKLRLSEVSRGALTTPLRFIFWTLKNPPLFRRGSVKKNRYLLLDRELKLPFLFSKLEVLIFLETT